MKEANLFQLRNVDYKTSLIKWLFILICAFQGLFAMDPSGRMVSNKCSNSASLGQRINSAPIVIVGQVIGLFDDYRADGGTSIKAMVTVVRVLKGENVIRSVMTNNMIQVGDLSDPDLCTESIPGHDDSRIWLLTTSQGNSEELKLLPSGLENAAPENIAKVDEIIRTGGQSFVVSSQQPSDSTTSTCGGQRCHPHGYCDTSPSSGISKCACPTMCPAGAPLADISGSVCGSDNRTYESLCKMRLDSCREHRLVSLKHRGECNVPLSVQCNGFPCPPYATCLDHASLPHPVCECPDPCRMTSDKGPFVCGSDDYSYTNICEMKRKACQTNVRITVKSTGMCQIFQNTANIRGTCSGMLCPPYATCTSSQSGQRKCKCPSLCPALDAPVCGSDGVTRPNQCVLELESCSNNRIITVAYRGSCKVKYEYFQIGDAPELNKPLSDQQVKSRNTLARRTPQSVSRKLPLKCGRNEDCPFARQTCDVNSGRCLCPTIDTCTLSGEVCGSDDVTYKSQCELEVRSCQMGAYISVSHLGQCDPCQNRFCPAGSECIRSLNRRDHAVCSCAHINCIRAWPDMICADDGETYSNECNMKRAACEKGQPLKVLYRGNCRSNPCSKVQCSLPGQFCRVDRDAKEAFCVCRDDCPQIMVPVCGSDQITYDSTCHLIRESCLARKDVWVVHKGKCNTNAYRCEPGCKGHQLCLPGASACACPTCPEEALGGQVCGSDQRTYRSECHLRAASCTSKKHDVKVIHQGPCDACQLKKCEFYAKCQMDRFGDAKCLCPTDCAYNHNQVCGSDGLTYNNECILQVQSCAAQKEVKVSSKGPCRSCPEGCPMGRMCLNGKCICRSSCPQNRLQVCGSDGIIYLNECELMRSACERGVTLRVDPTMRSCGGSGGDSGNRPLADSAWSDQKRLPSCRCNLQGSLSSQCDMATGQCHCKKNVVGRDCDRCISQTWGYHLDTGCVDCFCHPFGSLSLDCDQTDGQCTCRSGVFGKQCDVCPGIKVLGKNGCQDKEQPKQQYIIQGDSSAPDLEAVSSSDSFSFKSLSYVRLRRPDSITRYIGINMTLTLTSPNGILLHHGSFDKKEFLTLVIKASILQFRFDLGSGSALLESPRALRMSTTYQIYADRQNRKGNLMIKETGSSRQWKVSGKSPGKSRTLNTEPIVYIGIIPIINNETLKQTGGQTLGFTGCLQGFSIKAGSSAPRQYHLKPDDPMLEVMDRVDQGCQITQKPEVDYPVKDDIVKKSEQKDICSSLTPCRNGGRCLKKSAQVYECRCPLGFQGKHCDEVAEPIAEFDGSSYMSFSTKSIRIKKRLEIEIDLLTKSMSGLVCLITEDEDGSGDFLSVFLFNGGVQLTCRTGNGQVVVLRSQKGFRTDSWQKIRVFKTRKEIILDIDGKKMQRRILPRGIRKLSKQERKKVTEFNVNKRHFYLGGYPLPVHVPEALGTRVWLRGAVQKVLVNRQDFPLKSALFSNASQWSGLPCGPLSNPCSRQHLLCSPQLNTAMCICPSPSNPSYKASLKKNGGTCDDKLSFGIRSESQNLMVADLPDNNVPKDPSNKGKESNINFAPISKRGPINFNGQTYYKYKNLFVRRNRQSAGENIRLRFKTTMNHGMLLLVKKSLSANQDFLVLAVRDGYQEVAVNLGGDGGLIRIRAAIKVNDNRWHSVQVIRSHRSIQLIVDSNAINAELKSSDDTLDTDGWVWLGGHNNPMSRFPNEYNLNFIGCIADFELNKRRVDFSKDNRLRQATFTKCPSV